MARFKLASIFSQGTGKLGENVVVKDEAGYVGLRPRVTPSNPQSPPQMKVRGAQTESSQAWEGLTAEQCTAWRQLAKTLPQFSNKTGLPIKKQGFNVFCSYYDRFRLVNPVGIFPPDPPTTRMIEGTLEFQLGIAPGVVRVLSSEGNATGQVTEILLQKLAGKNRLPQEGAYRTKTYHAFTNQTPSLSLSVPVGTYAVAVRIVSAVDGRAGRLRPLGVTTVALAVAEGDAEAAPKARRKAA